MAWLADDLLPPSRGFELELVAAVVSLFWCRWWWFVCFDEDNKWLAAAAGLEQEDDDE